MNQPMEPLKDAARRLARVPLAQGYKPVALHEYTDAIGMPLYWRLRLKCPATGKKWIRPIMLEKGAYVMGEPVFIHGKPLYRLQALANNMTEPVFIVEGEACADALAKLGLQATTSGAADSADKADWQPLAGRRIVIWPDFDEAGQRYADAVAAKLGALDCSVQILDVTSLNLPAKGDVIDWLAMYPQATASDIAALPTSDCTMSLLSAQAASAASIGDSPDSIWPDPHPIQTPLKAVPAFDAAILLPEVLREWIMDEADRMPCPPDFIAVACMVALGSVVGARCAMQPKACDNWMIVPNLWGGVVGLPSAKKSPAINAALKPLERLTAREVEVFQAEQRAFQAEKTVFEAQEEAIKARIKSEAKGKEANKLQGLALELQDHSEQAPQAPVQRRFKVNDATVEKLGELLRDNPAGLLAVRDELVGLLAAWDKEGNEGERAFYLEAWNGNASFDTDRIIRGSIFIPNLCVSVFGGIQPDKLTGYLQQAAHSFANDGMLQRFQMLVYPDACEWEYRDRKPNKAACERAFALFGTLADFDPVSWGAQAADEVVKFPHFGFTAEAQAVFIEWLTEMHGKRLPAEEHPIIQQHLAKYDKLFPALALLLHLVECAATGQRGAVSMQAALRAAAWCEYLEAHMRRCYGLLIDEGGRAAQALAEKVRQGKLVDGFTAREVGRKKWQHLGRNEVVLQALEWLEDDGWLRSYDDCGTGPGGGRRTVRYLINPKAVNGNHGGVAA